MKISFVYPRFEKFLSNNRDLDTGLTEYFLGNFTTPPSLGIPILASLTPKDIDIEFIDDNNGDPFDFDSPRDLVAINCFTPQASRAFEIADEFRKRGTKVVMGGIFPSFMADECLKHADSVNIGEGEPTWPTILADARNGTLKRIYKGGCGFDLSSMKIPRREIFYQKDTYDWDEDLVQITRGCSYTCGMCSIPSHMGSKIRFRPIDQIVSEIKQLKYENVYIADDTLFFPNRKMLDYAQALFTSLIPLKKKYFVSSTMSFNSTTEFLDLLARAGVCNFYCTLNVDPISIRALSGGEKEQGILVDLVKKLKDRGINFFASCAIGREWDEKGIAGRSMDLLQKADVHTAEFFLFTPYPGSVHWDRLERQGRIVDRDWTHYNGAQVVFKPLMMSAEDLYGEFVKAWNDFFRIQKDSHTASLEPSTWQNGKKVLGKPLSRLGVKGQAAITGIGVLSPIGNDIDTMTNALQRGIDGLRPITLFDTRHFRTEMGGEVKGFEPREHLDDDEIVEYNDRYLHFAIAAARMAVKNAGIHCSRGVVRRDIALVLGSCNGGLLSAEEEYKWLHGKSAKKFNELLNLQAQYYGMGKALARAIGIGGETWLVTTACSSTTGAIGLATSLINLGYYTTVIVGGSDTLCVSNMSGFNGLKAIAPGKTAPFSLPLGINIGEASVFWVLEDLEQAMLRQTRIYGKVAGHALTCDAYHPTTPDPSGDGIRRTLLNALSDSGLALADIGCINAHGTGTEANDRAESRGIAKFLGDSKIPVTATKSFFGHCMGSAGILEATCNLIAMNAGFIPPTLHFSQPRPGCTLDYVPNIARNCRYHAFISANYAFGGNNAAITVTQWDFPNKRPQHSMNRVVITGTGTITSLGFGENRMLDALGRREIGLGGIERLKLTGLQSRRAGLVPPFKASDIDRKLDCTGMNLLSSYAASATCLALAGAGLQVRRGNTDSVGICMGACNGPPESDHMNSVFSTEDFAPDILNFSNITANSTAGWVAKALCLRGVNMTLSPGPHAGLQSLAYAFIALLENRAKAIAAGAADEVYPQMYSNYDAIGFLHRGIEEDNYRLSSMHDKRKIIGEGAAVMLVETIESASSRGAPLLAEILAYGMSMDAAPLSEPSMVPDGLRSACDIALSRCGRSWKDIGCVVWAPQGNRQDEKTLSVLSQGLDKNYPRIPLITTTFNTGYIESASILVSLCCALECFKTGQALWPQITGVPAIDSITMGSVPEYILAIAGSDLGYNYAVVMRTGGFISL